VRDQDANGEAAEAVEESEAVDIATRGFWEVATGRYGLARCDSEKLRGKDEGEACADGRCPVGEEATSGGGGGGGG